MFKKQNFIIKSIIAVLIIVCCLFTSCSDTGGSPNDNPIPGQVKGISFSHKSGLYSSSFSLTLTPAREGAKIYYSIDGSIPDASKVDNKVVFEYKSPINITDRNGQPNILATPENSKNFFMAKDDQRDPKNPPDDPYIPTDAQVPKATVIRAIAIESNGSKSSMATLTYFIGNNLSRYANHPIISLVAEPDGLVSEDRGILVRGASTNRWNASESSTYTIYNFLQRGEYWERVSSFEFFDSNRNVPISTTVGIRIRGGWSRDRHQKSFNVYFRSEYGTSPYPTAINNLKNYDLIPGAVQSNGKPVATYKSFMLRNGGNDTEQTKVYDVFIQGLLKDRAFTVQAAIPVIVYINGEYWGVYNMQERYSDNATEYKYGVNRDNVISYDNGALDDGNPGEENLYYNMITAGTQNMTESANYQAFCELVDIQNFIDYYAANLYINNEDWPGNNYRLWRTRTVESGNPYGDTKWRWQMFDTEYAMGIYSNGSTPDPFPSRIIDNGHDNARVLNSLIQNPEFARQFVNTMMDLYNVNFHPDNCLPELDRLANIYRPLMVDYVERFTWWRTFDPNITNARNYLLNIRYPMVNNYLPIHLGASGLTNVTFAAKHDTNVMNSMSMKINTVTPKPNGGAWSGQYYQSSPITVTANDISGYTFKDWTVNGGTILSGSGTKTITVSLSGGNSEITANYTSDKPIINVSNVTLNKTTLTLFAGQSEKLIAAVLPANATYKTVTWTSNNNSVATVDQNGNVTALGGGNTTITAAAGGVSKSCNVTVKVPEPLLIEGPYKYTDGTGAVEFEQIGVTSEYKINVTNEGTGNWHAVVGFSYSDQGQTQKGKQYNYSFLARTDSGTRNLYVQYYWKEGFDGKGQTITLNDTYQHFSFIGAALPTADGAKLEFQGGTQKGIFYVKDIVITPIP